MIPNPPSRRTVAALILSGALSIPTSLSAEQTQRLTPTPPTASIAAEVKAAWYTLSPEQFAALPEAGKPLQISALDANLLAAAILHATNQQRAEHRLPALEYDPAATQAARLQADAMAKVKILSHENDSDPTLKTPVDRVRKVGLKPRFVAENVALEFARQYRSGDAFYTRTVNGETVPSATPDGPPIPMHSYASFAAALLDGWMHSPDHRANILSDKPRRLGCAAAASRDANGLEVFYCAQVFFTPKDEPQPN